MSRSIRAGDTFVLDADPKCKCGNHARLFLELHRVHGCDEELTTGSFLCKDCNARTLLRLTDLCGRAARVGLRCQTCDREIVTLADMVVRIVSLDK